MNIWYGMMLALVAGSCGPTVAESTTPEVKTETGTETKTRADIVTERGGLLTV